MMAAESKCIVAQKLLEVLPAPEKPVDLAPEKPAPVLPVLANHNYMLNQRPCFPYLDLSVVLTRATAPKSWLPPKTATAPVPEQQPIKKNPITLSHVTLAPTPLINNNNTSPSQHLSLASPLLHTLQPSDTSSTHATSEQPLQSILLGSVPSALSSTTF